jgi:hypothetical protein
MAKKSWVEKRDLAKPIKIELLEKDFIDLKAGTKMLVAHPGIDDRYIRKIKPGTAVETKTLRREIALQYDADRCCPLVTGIFLRILAEAAHEEYCNGKPLHKISPFWRVITPDSAIADKLSFGKELLMKMRKKEGLAN